jgi:hypothetical protein
VLNAWETFLLRQLFARMAGRSALYNCVREVKDLGVLFWNSKNILI